MKSIPLVPLLLSLVGVAVLNGCIAPRTVGINQQKLDAASDGPEAERIRWPQEYVPNQAAFHVHNEIQIQAPPAKVWEFLVRAEEWPRWYEGAADVKVIQPAGVKLAPDAVFSWRTMGQSFESRVKEFELHSRLAWEGRKPVIRGYHAWLLIPTDGGCRVVTAESFHGFLGYMQRLFIPQKLYRLHDVWLRELKRKAEAMPAEAVAP